MTPRTICLTLSLLLTAGVAFAQPEVEWERTYGGGSEDACYSTIQTADGGFAMAGYAESFGAGSYDFWLIRTDSDGDSLWSRTYGGGGNDQCYSLIQTADGGFALAGVTSSFGAGDLDFWLVCTNEDGDSLWSRTYGRVDRQECFSLIQTADGGFALAGYTGSFVASSYEFWLVRTDGDGDSLWSRTIHGQNRDYCNSIIQIADGGFALAGSTGLFGGGGDDFWLVRTDGDGDSLWSRTFGGEHGNLCNSLILTADGGFAMGGFIRPSVDGGFDFWLVRTDENGDSLWSNAFGGDNNDFCTSLIQTADGGFTMGGYTESFGAGGDDFWLLRTDEQGDSLWSCTFGGVRTEYCRSLIQTANRGFAISGSSDSYGAGQRFYLVKTTPDPVSVRQSHSTLNPLTFNLYPSFPNPFNSTVRFSFEQSAKSAQSAVRLTIFDPLGRRLADVIPSQVMTAGSHSAIWNANAFPAGSYLVRLESGSQSLTQPIRLVK